MIEQNKIHNNDYYTNLALEYTLHLENVKKAENSESVTENGLFTFLTNDPVIILKYLEILYGSINSALIETVYNQLEEFK